MNFTFSHFPGFYSILRGNLKSKLIITQPSTNRMHLFSLRKAAKNNLYDIDGFPSLGSGGYSPSDKGGGHSDPEIRGRGSVSH